MSRGRGFSSDNNAGVHPAVLAAIADANEGHVGSYGADPYTVRAEELFREQFGATATAFLVNNGTAANVLALQALTRPHHAVLCAEGAHINVDECGAPERFAGCKLIPIPTADGKLRPADITSRLGSRGDEHRNQPRVVSIAQCTELGTVYRPEEIRALAEVAHANDLALHLDGARIANAAVFLNLPLRAFTTDVGVDVLSFGGTKNGLMGAEAVLFLNRDPDPDFKYIRKQAMQLSSKMRFLAAQFIALLSDDLWRRNAARANAMARRLAEAVGNVPGVRVTQPVEANGVFARIPAECVAPLQERSLFSVWTPETSEVRWMTAFDTTEDDVDRFAAAIRAVVG
jgi:threonine aldolase